MGECQWRSEGGLWGLNPHGLSKKFFHHVIWITVVFRSNDSRCLLWKFCAIRVTRWLLWHPNCIKFNFGRGSAPDPAGGAYDALPDHLVGFPLPIPYPLDAFGVSLSTPWEFLATPLKLSNYYCTESSHITALRPAWRTIIRRRVFPAINCTVTDIRKRRNTITQCSYKLKHRKTI